MKNDKKLERGEVIAFGDRMYCHGVLIDVSLELIGDTVKTEDDRESDDQMFYSIYRPSKHYKPGDVVTLITGESACITTLPPRSFGADGVETGYVVELTGIDCLANLGQTARTKVQDEDIAGLES